MRVIFIICLFVFATTSFNPLYVESNEDIITISDGLKIAVENNKLVKIALYEKDMSYEDIAIARSKLLPNINVHVSQTFLTHQPGAHMGTQHIYTSERSYLSYGINAYQNIFSFGENTSRYEASRNHFLKQKNLI